MARTSAPFAGRNEPDAEGDRHNGKREWLQQTAIAETPQTQQHHTRVAQNTQLC